MITRGATMGLFITFEGPDGSGKTTVAKAVFDYFSRDHEMILTREPGGIGIAEEIRELVLNPKFDTMDDRTEALLYAASRRQHLVEKVIPALELGKHVICDRFVDSSLAYQGYARGIGVDEVWHLNQFAIESHMPDVTIFVDCDPETGLLRTGKRGAKDRLELAGNDFHQRVYDGYKSLIKKFPERIIVIDGTKTKEEVAAAAIKVLEGYIK